jgi:hypothetical protein
MLGIAYEVEKLMQGYVTLSKKYPTLGWENKVLQLDG